MENWERVYFSNQIQKINIVRAVLHENNIQSVVMDKRDSSYISVGDIEVMVKGEDAIFARLIIEQLHL
jgi:hypothetical protein